MGSDKGSLLEILLSRKMRLSLFFIIVLVAVSGIQSEDNSENESDISKEAIKAVAQDNVGIDFQKTLYREKRGGNEKGKAKTKGKNGKKKGTRNMKKEKGNNKIGKGTKSGKGNRSGKGKVNTLNKKGNKSTSRAAGKMNKSKAKMKKSPKKLKKRGNFAKKKGEKKNGKQKT